ncbi:MAG: DUF3795 domain-containing protein [Bacillota bacterium]
MKMPDRIDDAMLAPCGMNCAVCYKHVGMCKRAKPCGGCLKSDGSKPDRCQKCKIKNCAKEKGYVHCFKCADFPCKLIRNMELSYNRRYGVSIIENSRMSQENGISEFLAYDRRKWTCATCGGAISLHDGICSDCGSQRPSPWGVKV